MIEPLGLDLQGENVDFAMAEHERTVAYWNAREAKMAENCWRLLLTNN